MMIMMVITFERHEIPDSSASALLRLLEVGSNDNSLLMVPTGFQNSSQDKKQKKKFISKNCSHKMPLTKQCQ